MPVYFDQRNKRYRFEFNRKIGGRRYRATKLLPAAWDAEKADEWARNEEARIYALASGQVKPEYTISAAVKLFIDERLEDLKSKKDYLREFENLMPLYKGKLVSQLADVATEIMKLKISAATKKNKISYLRAACRHAYKRGKCHSNPSDNLVLPKVSNERHVYPKRKEVLQTARRVKNKDIRAAILAAFYSGMRQAEIRRVDIESGVFWLADTKNGTPRAIPIHPKLRVYAKRLPCKYSRSWISQKFNEARPSKNVRFHDLRHGAASEMINAGVPLNTVGDVLGHKDHKSTKRYSHLLLETLEEAVKKIGAKPNKSTQAA